MINSIKELKEILEKYEYLIEYVYGTCLCERFKTKGFDYHEKHPNRDDNNGGSRPSTPRDMIETMIGFKWSEGGKYPKQLTFKKLNK